MNEKYKDALGLFLLQTSRLLNSFAYRWRVISPGDFEHTTTSAFIAYNFWTAAKKQWPTWPNERIKYSIQDSIQKSLLKFVKVCEISLSKIEFKIVKVV